MYRYPFLSFSLLNIWQQKQNILINSGELASMFNSPFLVFRSKYLLRNIPPSTFFGKYSVLVCIHLFKKVSFQVGNSMNLLVNLTCKISTRSILNDYLKIYLQTFGTWFILTYCSVTIPDFLFVRFYDHSKGILTSDYSFRFCVVCQPWNNQFRSMLLQRLFFD